MPLELTASHFIERLEALQSADERKKYERIFKFVKDNQYMGVRMGHIFALAKEFIDMPLDEVETLLESPYHEQRVGALSIMDKQARRKKITESERKALYDLYIRRHDRINSWDLVDVCCPHVVGGYLLDKPRDILYKLAKSKNTWERRTSVVATLFFIRQGEVDDAINIAEMLLSDDQDLIHKATGWALREAGGVDRARLVAFLDRYAATMPRVTLRYAIEHFEPGQREHYLNIKKAK